MIDANITYNNENDMPKLDQRKKTTNNNTVWSVYIEGQRSWAKWKDVLFVSIPIGEKVYLTDQSKNIVNKSIYLKNGYKLTLLSNKSVSYGNQKLIYVSHKNIKGYLPISKVGYVTKNTTLQEDKSLKNIDSIIKSIDEIGKGITIIVKNRDKTIYTFENCIGAKSNPGTPKSDYFIYDHMKRPVCEISHKKAGGAEHFQQYASITGRADDALNQHSFIKEALNRFAPLTDEIAAGKRKFIRIPFNDKTKNLIAAAIFGVKYNESFGKNHVHLVGQGDPVLKHVSGLTYELTYTSHLAVSGDIDSFMKNGYEPIILARPGADRSFQAGNIIYKKVRILIAPIKLKGTATEIT